MRSPLSRRAFLSESAGTGLGSLAALTQLRALAQQRRIAGPCRLPNGFVVVLPPSCTEPLKFAGSEFQRYAERLAKARGSITTDRALDGARASWCSPSRVHSGSRIYARAVCGEFARCIRHLRGFESRQD